jgi:putative zinc finger protein
MTLTCKEAAHMVSEGLDKGLSLDEQLRLRAHLAICGGCRSIGERLAFLRRAVVKLVDRDNSADT